MTRRLYYTDSMLGQFEAMVVRADRRGDRFEVVLDQTAFYPTSGGQPFDTGRLGGATVVDVVDDEASGDVVHLVSDAVEVGQRVTGTVDWSRRADHMQQHTGQHVLSAAFDRLIGVATVSFHLGPETSTIDLAREVTPEEFASAEAEACRVVWDDRPVSVRFVTDEEAAALALRKTPARTGTLRLVDVADFDLSACGGTHVQSTGRIGIIAVAGYERFKGASRITFVCGGRALRSHGRLRDVVSSISRVLSAPAAELAASAERLLAEGRSLQKQVKRQAEELAGYRASEYSAAAETIGTLRGVLRAELDLDASGIKALAQAIVRGPGLVVVLVGAGDPAAVVAARSADVSWDAGAWVKDAAARFGGRGGGRPELAQGGLPASAEAILADARSRLA